MIRLLLLLGFLAESLAATGDTPELARCIASYAKLPGVNHSAVARQICEAPTDGGRECVYKNYVGQKKFRFMRDAVEICQYRSDSARSCLLAYTNDEPPFNLSADELERLFPILRSAAPVCEIDNHRDRTCVVRMLRKGLERNPIKAYYRCLAIGAEYASCASIVTQTVGPKLVAQICAIPNFSIRSCLLAKYKSGQPEPFYPGFRAICEAEFLKNLFDPLEGSAFGEGCKFEP